MANLRDEVRIDEFIKSCMLYNYKTRSAAKQRVFRCFLEKYCYRSHDDVSEVIR